MRDWEGFVRQRLSGLVLDAGEKDEVQLELAAHLEESYESLRTKGLPEQAAMQQTLAQVADWQDLRRRIQIARTMKENIMNDRVRQLWLPGLLTLFLSMGLLMLIQFLGPNPWIVARKSGWLLIAPVAVVYVPWLLLLPVIGAMGAYLSNRAGGSRRAIFSSIVFPVLPYLALIFIGVPVALIVDAHVAHNVMLGAFFVGLFAWVIFPGVALLVGGLLVQLFASRGLNSRRIAGS